MRKAGMAAVTGAALLPAGLGDVDGALDLAIRIGLLAATAMAVGAALWLLLGGHDQAAREMVRTVEELSRHEGPPRGHRRVPAGRLASPR